MNNSIYFSLTFHMSHPDLLLKSTIDIFTLSISTMSKPLDPHNLLYLRMADSLNFISYPFCH